MSALHRFLLAAPLVLVGIFALGASADAGGEKATAPPFDGRWVAMGDDRGYQQFPFAAIDIAPCADGLGLCGRLVQESDDCGPEMLRSDPVPTPSDGPTGIWADARFDGDDFRLKLSLSDGGDTLTIRGVKSIEALVRRSPSMVTRFRRDDAARCEPVQS